MIIMEVFLGVFAVSVFLFMLIGGISTYFKEKKWWNNGICPRNGQKWIYFDSDSQGGTGYKTPDNKYVCWVSWGIDK